MQVIIVRTVIFYFLVTLAVRLMGKRQIGELQPTELVVTILVSELAAIPMQDVSVPIMTGIITIFGLVVLEILVSVLEMKSKWVRQLLSGKPVLVVSGGEIDQKALRKLRFTVDDFLEELRQVDVFRLDEIAYAIVETNGKISVIKKPQYQQATAEMLGQAPEDTGLPTAVIVDGKLKSETLSRFRLTPKKVDSILKKQKLSVEDVFIMQVDNQSQTIICKQGEEPER